MSKCKCAKRIAALERDVTKLRAQLPKEIHHATRHEVQVALKERDTTVLPFIKAPDRVRAIASGGV